MIIHAGEPAPRANTRQSQRKYKHCRMVVYATFLGFWSADATEGAVVEIIRPQSALEERIRELCGKAAAADESEAQSLLDELKALLAQHSELVRFLAAKTLNRLKKSDSSTNAA